MTACSRRPPLVIRMPSEKQLQAEIRNRLEDTKLQYQHTALDRQWLRELRAHNKQKHAVALTLQQTQRCSGHAISDVPDQDYRRALMGKCDYFQTGLHFNEKRVREWRQTERRLCMQLQESNLSSGRKLRPKTSQGIIVRTEYSEKMSRDAPAFSEALTLPRDVTESAPLPRDVSASSPRSGREGRCPSVVSDEPMPLIPLETDEEHVADDSAMKDLESSQFGVRNPIRRCFSASDSTQRTKMWKGSSKRVSSPLSARLPKKHKDISSHRRATCAGIGHYIKPGKDIHISDPQVLDTELGIIDMGPGPTRILFDKHEQIVPIHSSGDDADQGKCSRSFGGAELSTEDADGDPLDSVQNNIGQRRRSAYGLCRSVGKKILRTNTDPTANRTTNKEAFMGRQLGFSQERGVLRNSGSRKERRAGGHVSNQSVPFLTSFYRKPPATQSGEDRCSHNRGKHPFTRASTSVDGRGRMSGTARTHQNLHRSRSSGFYINGKAGSPVRGLALSKTARERALERMLDTKPVDVRLQRQRERAISLQQRVKAFLIAQQFIKTVQNSLSDLNDHE